MHILMGMNICTCSNGLNKALKEWQEPSVPKLAMQGKALISCNALEKKVKAD